MNIVTKISKINYLVLFIDLFVFLFILFIHLFYIPIIWKIFFCVFFRALGEPLDQDSVPVGQSLKYTSINQKYYYYFYYYYYYYSYIFWKDGQIVQN